LIVATAGRPWLKILLGRKSANDIAVVTVPERRGMTMIG
jgi:hypothetical protein